MFNKYKNVDIIFNNNEMLKIEGHYQYKIKGNLVKKALNLAYKIEAPSNSKMSIKTFLEIFIDKILKDGILNLQSNSVCWKKIVLKTQNSLFSYSLSEILKGAINKPPKAGAYYQFGIQIGENSSIVILNLSGVPAYIPVDNIYTCEELLISPLEFPKSNIILSICGIKSVTENFSVAGGKIMTHSPKIMKSKINRKNGKAPTNSK